LRTLAPAVVVVRLMGRELRYGCDVPAARVGVFLVGGAGGAGGGLLVLGVGWFGLLGFEVLIDAVG
jgi:hypothetical protein